MTKQTSHTQRRSAPAPLFPHHLSPIMKTLAPHTQSLLPHCRLQWNPKKLTTHPIHRAFPSPSLSSPPPVHFSPPWPRCAVWPDLWGSTQLPVPHPPPRGHTSPAQALHKHTDSLLKVPFLFLSPTLSLSAFPGQGFASPLRSSLGAPSRGANTVGVQTKASQNSRVKMESKRTEPLYHRTAVSRVRRDAEHSHSQHECWRQRQGKGDPGREG